MSAADLAEQWRALLGDDVIAEIHARVQATPELSPEAIDDLRRVLAMPAGRRASRAAADAA